MNRSRHERCPFWREAPGLVRVGGYVWHPRLLKTRPLTVGDSLVQIFVEQARCPEAGRGHRFHLVGQCRERSQGKDGWVYAIHGRDAVRYAVREWYHFASGYSDIDTDPSFVLLPRCSSVSCEDRHA